MTKESKKKIIVSAFACLLVALLVCIGFLIYCGIMTSYTAYTDAGTFESVPSAYKKKCDKEGKIVSLNYTTSTYYSVPTVKSAYIEDDKYDRYLTMEDVELNKVIYVYLPYGYDESDTSTKYDVLYHLHGTTCDGTTLVKGVGKDSETKNVLDNMIENGDMKPTIVVFPTWYNGLSVDEDDPDYLISHFDTEFRNDIIPLVERTYHTYAGVTATMTEEEVANAIVASREHRAVSGYSRGGTLTWYVFTQMLNYFKYYLPMSGDYLLEFTNATDASCTAKVEELISVIDSFGYTKDDYYIFSAVGALDFAYYGVNMQFNAMLKRSDYFPYGKEEGNLYLCVAPQIWHGDTMSPMYFYNALQQFFK
jgi:hypothetical protein